MTALGLVSVTPDADATNCVPSTSGRNGSARWARRKENIKDRQNRQCLFCGRGEAKYRKLEIHHVKKQEHGGTDARRNVLAACPACHRLIHNVERKYAVCGAPEPCPTGSPAGVDLGYLGLPDAVPRLPELCGGQRVSPGRSAFASVAQHGRGVKFFAWGYGWLRLEGLPVDETGRRYLRQIRRGLAGRPYRAGPFRVERSGRWGIAFLIDPEYAAQRAPRRRRSRAHASGPAGWDERFQRGTGAAQELFDRGRRLVAEHAEENPLPTATDMPTDYLAAEPEEDWWLCSHCKAVCPENPVTGLPMACHCDGAG